MGSDGSPAGAEGGEGVMVGLVTPSAKRTMVPQDANDGPCDSNELLVAGLHVE